MKPKYKKSRFWFLFFTGQVLYRADRSAVADKKNAIYFQLDFECYFPHLFSEISVKLANHRFSKPEEPEESDQPKHDALLKKKTTTDDNLYVLNLLWQSRSFLESR